MLTVGLLVHVANLPVATQGQQGVQGMQGLKGDKGDKGDQGLRGPMGMPGKDAVAKLGSVASPDFQTGFLTLGGGAAFEGQWAQLNTATSAVFASNPATVGIFGTSSLVDVQCHIDATSTAGAIITMSRVSSQYASTTNSPVTGFATSSSFSVELGSTTWDLAKGGAWISLQAASTSIFGDMDGTNFDPEKKEAFDNRWNPLTDVLLVNVQAKNVDYTHTSNTPQTLTGACAGFWRTVR